MQQGLAISAAHHGGCVSEKGTGEPARPGPAVMPSRLAQPQYPQRRAAPPAATSTAQAQRRRVRHMHAIAPRLWSAATERPAHAESASRERARQAAQPRSKTGADHA